MTPMQAQAMTQLAEPGAVERLGIAALAVLALIGVFFYFRKELTSQKDELRGDLAEAVAEAKKDREKCDEKVSTLQGTILEQNAEILRRADEHAKQQIELSARLATVEAEKSVTGDLVKDLLAGLRREAGRPE